MLDDNPLVVRNVNKGFFFFWKKFQELEVKV